MQLLLMVYLLGSLVLFGFALPLLLGKISPNGFYGFRTSQTINNPQLWYAVNRYAARYLIVTAFVFALAAVVLYVLPGISLDGYALGCLAVFVLLFGISLVQSIRYIRQMAPGGKQE